MNKINALVAFSLLGLSACGSGSSGSSFDAPKVLNGVFKDSNVHGLAFTSKRENGITDREGKFTYEEGEAVTFSIGGVVLGSTVGKSVITPLDLVKDGTLKSTEVANIVRFLMMLDKDNTPSNGIEISPKVQQKAKDWESIDFKSSDFPTEVVQTIRTDASVEDGITHEFPSAEAAVKHLRTTLLCANAGAYVGTYTGTEEGKIVLMVDPTTGKVKGSSYNPDNQTSVEIKSTAVINYDLDLKFLSTEDSAKKFFGKPVSADKLEGTWFDSNNSAKKGFFSVERIGADSKAIYRYATTYTGDGKGLYLFNVDSNNKIKGLAYDVAKSEQIELEGNISQNAKKQNLITVKSTDKDDDTEIVGKISDDLVVEGLWSNLKELSNGDFLGAGCKLN